MRVIIIGAGIGGLVTARPEDVIAPADLEAIVTSYARAVR